MIWRVINWIFEIIFFFALLIELLVRRAPSIIGFCHSKKLIGFSIEFELPSKSIRIKNEFYDMVCPKAVMLWAIFANTMNKIHSSMWDDTVLLAKLVTNRWSWGNC